MQKRTKLSIVCISLLISLSLALPSQAATVTELQATINALIAQVTALQAQLALLQSSTSSSLPLNCAGITFNRPLLQGSYGNDVKCLQTLLNRNTDTRIANSGPGSLGQETYYFGYLTKLAVIRLQNKYASEILTPSRLTYGTGIVGPSTRTKLNTICSSFTTTIPPVTTPTTTIPVTPTTTIQDLISPAAISSLYVSNITNNSIALTWTAPGDDGTIGTAYQYDIRYSTSLINDSNWSSAAQASGEPAPFNAGTSQSFILSGLSASTTYYFAIKSSDESNNISPLSNIVSGKTLSPLIIDTAEPVRSNSTPSGTLTSGTTQTTISLSTNESATCKYSTTAGTAYSSMTGTFTTTGGTTHSKAITGLTNGTSYTYYVRCTDSSNNVNTSDHAISFAVSSPSCNDCGLGTPTITPTSPISNTSFTITCPANNTGYDCINAYANGSSNKCTYSSWSGNNVIFNCTGLTTGSYTSRCEAITGTSRNCCAASKTGSYSVQTIADITVPTRSGGSPSGTLTAGTTQTTISLSTNESATCKYSLMAGTAYSSMTGTFTTTGGTTHSKTITGLTNGTGYVYYVRCTDSSNNVNTSDYTISFSVSSPSVTTGITLTSPNGGETWQRGTTHTITWNYTGSPGPYAKIALLKAGTEIGTIIASTTIGSSGTGSYMWDISADISLTVGSDMAVSVQSISQSTVKDASNAYFTLTPATVSDTTPPSQITNPSASNLTQTSVTLTWTAPGDDGTVGTATSYDIRYSTASITSSNWTSATAASGEPTPSTSGTSQTFTVTGLAANTTYYFAIKAIDDVNNASVLSNVVSGKTLAAKSLTLEGIQIFPKDHIYNTRADNLPVDAKSDIYINTLIKDTGSKMSLSHYIFNAIPYNVVDSATPHQYVNNFGNKGAYSDNVPYPIPNNPLYELGCNDHHMEIIDADEMVLYELYAVNQLTNGSWEADLGAVWDLKNYSFRKNNITPMWGADESGLPLFPGLVRYDEVSAGYINHALRIAVPIMQNTWVWPARATAPLPLAYDPAEPPAGQRFRLKASYDISGFPPQTKVILQALKTYGAMASTLNGAGNPVTIVGSPDSRWDSSDLSSLSRVKISDLEAVNVSSLMIDSNSAQARSSVLPTAAAITLTSPNGGETWQRGTTHTITWNYTGSPGPYAKIALLKAGTEIGTIIASTTIGSSGTGSYVWDISADTSLSIGSDLSVSVQSINQSTAKDASNAYFTLLPASACNSCGLGSPVITPTSPISNTSFTITCPANNTGYDCINAYANGSSNKCTYSSWSGSNVIFSCTGLTKGSYTSKCEAVTGTSRNCCAANTTGSYTVQVVSDTTPPNQITNLSASNLTQSSVTLTWTAPGDDGTTGKATSYDIRYSTASITSSNWTSATAASGEPAPSTSGTSQTFTVTGLAVNTTYYFAIKAIDDAGNASALSNILSSKTLAITSDCYGAEACNPTGNPIGGGAGYNKIVKSGNKTVTTASQFISALATAVSGDVIFIPSTATIDLTGHYGLTVPNGVTIASDRGYNGSLGGRIFRSHIGDNDIAYSHIQTFNAGENTRFTGLRIEGTDTLQDECFEDPADPHCATPIPTIEREVRSAIHCNGAVEIDNCEMWGWSYAAIKVNSSGNAYVHHNYIHHCQARGYGYGVALYNGYSVIEANIFDYTRHAITGTGYPNEGYEARYNIHLGHGDAYGGHHFDVHGYSYNGGTIAGKEYKIHHNTFETTSLYSLGIRGMPIIGVYVDHNIFKTSWSGYVGFQKASKDVYANVFMTKNMISGVLQAVSTLKHE